MELEDYQQIHMNFRVAVAQTRFISVAAGDVLKEFPHRLPNDTRQNIVKAYKSFFDGIGKAVWTAKKRKVRPSKRKTRYRIHLVNPVARSATLLMLDRFLAGEDVVEDTDFNQLLCAQELVMLIAHLDGFLSDSLRAICKREPNVLHSNKQMRWDRILNQGSWQNLIESMIEEHLYSFGWKSISDRVTYLKSEYGVSIPTSASLLLLIDEAEKIRHIVIHNGGKVSQEYKDRTGRTDVKIGEVIPINTAYTDRIKMAVATLGIDIFTAVAQKFFNAKKEDLRMFTRSSDPITSSRQSKSRSE